MQMAAQGAASSGNTQSPKQGPSKDPNDGKGCAQDPAFGDADAHAGEERQDNQNGRRVGQGERIGREARPQGRAIGAGLGASVFGVAQGHIEPDEEQNDSTHTLNERLMARNRVG